MPWGLAVAGLDGATVQVFWQMARATEAGRLFVLVGATGEA